MTRVGKAAAIACLLGTLRPAAARAVSRDASWVFDKDGVLELLLAHKERLDPDVGVLRVDPTRGALSWEGVGDHACPHRIEAAFDDVKAVRSRREGSFVVELRGQRAIALVLIPLPNRAWLAAQHAVAPRLDRFFEGSETFPDRGSSRAAGSPGSGAAALPALVAPPAGVAADTRRAVELIREALGRAPTPAVVLRETLYGTPIDSSVEELLEEPAAYSGRAVRVVGRLEPSGEAPGAYHLRGEGAAVTAIPERDIAVLVLARLPAQGADVEVAGVFQARRDQPVLDFWELSVLGASTPETATDQAQPTTLEALASNPRSARGRTVRVVGKFRGGNLYGDLPATSRRGEADWVIKDGRWAVWVTGARPAGAGWALDPRSREDAGYWVEVVARPTTRNGFTYLRARKVDVIPPPRGAHVEPGRRVVVRRDTAPSVVFTLPVEGERVGPDGRFVVQFNKYMDEGSFSGRVRLLYPDSPEAAGREVPVRAWYDEEHRALIVDPLEELERGREIELRLLPGLLDVDGLALVPRGGADSPGAVTAIRSLVE